MQEIFEAQQIINALQDPESRVRKFVDKTLGNQEYIKILEETAGWEEMRVAKIAEEAGAKGVVAEVRRSIDKDEIVAEAIFEKLIGVIQKSRKNVLLNIGLKLSNSIVDEIKRIRAVGRATFELNIAAEKRI